MRMEIIGLAAVAMLLLLVIIGFRDPGQSCSGSMRRR